MTFQSFFMAGFECATGYNSGRRKIDQIAATQHDARLADDYAMLVDMGIESIREGIRWPVIDRCGKLELEEVRRIVRTANRYGIELILDLFHYGYPDDLDPLASEFQDRFADYCGAIAMVVAAESDVPVHFTPVNEPSYFAWAAGDAAKFAPYLTGRAMDLKIAFVQAAIAGTDAIRYRLPSARIVSVDPICRVAAPLGRSDLEEEVRHFNETAVFECWDMLAGKLHPELGGSPEYLDIVGINYYWTNQWEFGRPGEPLAMEDERLTPLSDLIRSVWTRYRRPMLITETSHVAHMRGPWLRYVVDEVSAVRSEGLPLNGVCIYPVIGMPEWHEPEVWVRMGLWDCLADSSGNLQRVPEPTVFYEYFEAVNRFREIEEQRQALAIRPTL